MNDVPKQYFYTDNVPGNTAIFVCRCCELFTRAPHMTPEKRFDVDEMKREIMEVAHRQMSAPTTDATAAAKEKEKAAVSDAPANTTVAAVEDKAAVKRNIPIAVASDPTPKKAKTNELMNLPEKISRTALNSLNDGQLINSDIIDVYLAMLCSARTENPEHFAILPTFYNVNMVHPPRKYLLTFGAEEDIKTILMPTFINNNHFVLATTESQLTMIPCSSL